jgi:hypothetical protein
MATPTTAAIYVVAWTMDQVHATPIGLHAAVKQPSLVVRVSQGKVTGKHVVGEFWCKAKNCTSAR